MRAIVFTTGTPDTEKLVGSFACLGHQTQIVQYDVPNVDVVKIAEAARPDVAVYIGAIRQYHNRWVPDTDTLCRLNRIVPTIHLCSDAGDPPWWPVLEEYQAANAFRLQVSIDGCFDTPLAKFGLVELTPIDLDNFSDAPWHDRIYACGFAGGGGSRNALLDHLKRAGVLEHLGHYGKLRYRHICAFYTLCRYVVNDAKTGSGTRRHVKGRFLEAALAGAVPIEPEDSPARKWFDPGDDYLTWSSFDDVIRHARSDVSKHENMANRLRAKARAKHSARPFWNRVLRATNV